MAARFLRLPRNRHGRDFAAGDLHGHLDLLKEALAAVDFDKRADRLFLLGDTINRGPRSARMCKLLGKPYVYSVLGNHEKAFLDLLSHGRPPRAARAWMARRFGMHWVLDASERVLEKTRAALARLPLAIETECGAGRVGFVHAQVPIGLSWDEFARHIEAGERDVAHEAVWGRGRIERGVRQPVAGIDRVFVGHTIVDRPRVLGNVVALDTGAHSGARRDDPRCGRLTLVNIACTEAQLRAAPAARRLVDVRDCAANEAASGFLLGRAA